MDDISGRILYNSFSEKLREKSLEKSKEAFMIRFTAGTCDVAVIGAGHAGIEAALAAARLGMETICFTVNLDSVGNMP